MTVTAHDIGIQTIPRARAWRLFTVFSTVCEIFAARTRNSAQHPANRFASSQL
jgi:hypothetical protein